MIDLSIDIDSVSWIVFSWDLWLDQCALSSGWKLWLLSVNIARVSRYMIGKAGNADEGKESGGSLVKKCDAYRN